MIERYSRPDMRRIWSDQTRYETWLEVELAVCRAMEAREMVPAGTADRVRIKVVIEPARILEIESRVRHDVIAFLSHIEEQAGEPARWLHLGMTSSDVLDTSFALQLRQAGGILLGRIDELCTALERRARELADVAMVGRSHGMHAEPTSVGLVFAGYFAEMKRNRRRLERALSNIARGKIAGAVGVYGNITPEIEAEALGALGLVPETVATQIVPRDRHAELFNALALLGASIERIAVQVRHWQRSEVAEAREPFGEGQKGSSAMPHKRNPILTENLCGLARLLRSYAGAALENVALWHERDISHSSVERVIAPDATMLTDFMLHRMVRVVDGLVVEREALARNLELSGGLVFSEAVLLSLVRAGLGRQEAYGHVQRCAMRAHAGEGQFKELLAEDNAIASTIGRDGVERCFDLGHHLRYVETIFQRVFEEEKNP
ncbi:MAG: adenylosuccinate lyase [Myxococcales bacterium]|nr:adenylosuccinate lyase [Myxococcales bacterium]